MWSDVSLWFWFAFPWWLVMLSIFSYTFWPSSYLLWKKCLFRFSVHFLVQVVHFLAELFCMFLYNYKYIKKDRDQKTVWMFLTKLNILLPHDPAIKILSIYSNGVENLCPSKNLHMNIYITFFIIAKAWKQPWCSSVGKWKNKLWYIQTLEYYSALKRNEL